MPGDKPYTNTWMRFTHVEKWETKPGDTGVTGELVSNWMTQMLWRIQSGMNYQNVAYADQWTQYLELNGPFAEYQVETWNVIRADYTDDAIDGDIEHKGGLTWPYKHTKVNSPYAKTPCFGHEFGHNYGYVCGIFTTYNRPEAICRTLEAIYVAMRGAEFTYRTAGPERFAEDFKALFGPDGVANVDDPNDDSNQPGLGYVRKAKDVPGLKTFIQIAWPVYNRLKNKYYQNFTYDTSNGFAQWENQSVGQWECIWQGQFYKWTQTGWQVTT